MNTIDTTIWERSSNENWASPSPTSLKMLKNLNHDYIVSDVEFANYTLTSDVTTLQGDDDGIGVVFDYIDSQNYKYIMYQGGGLTFHPLIDTNSVTLVEVLNGTETLLMKNTGFKYWSINSTFSIKLENVFDDIVFYVDNVETIRYKKDNSVSGKIGFITYSQICDFNNIEIYQSNANRMKARYTLYAVDSDEVFTEIEVARNETHAIETEISPRAIGENLMNTEIFAIYRGNSVVLTEIQPIGFNTIPTEIEVRPHNRMWAIYEVQQPPIITTVLNPTQDAFTREQSAFETINYGSNSSMVVGRSEEDIWRSFVQFDTSFVNPSYVLTESYLRLYYKGIAPSSLKIEILNADSAWQEHNITNLNRPNPIQLITNEFTVNETDKCIEFNVIDIVKSWVALNQINNGFVIRLSNETEFGQTTFHTRESVLPPELVVKHYDSRIFSMGRSQQLTEIFVYRRKDSDKNTEITVDSAFSFSAPDTEIYVHRAEVPLDSDTLVEITVSKPSTYAEFTVSIRKDNDVNTVISARNPKESRVLAELTVSKPLVNAEIYIKHINDIQTEITPRVIGDSDVDTQLSVNRPFANVEITPSLRRDSSTDTEITIAKPLVYVEITVYDKGDNETLVEIEIINEPSSKVESEILVSKDRVLTEIAPRVERRSDLYTSIEATRAEVHVEIAVMYRSDIWVEIEPNIKSDTITEIISNKPAIESEISVVGYENSLVDTEVFVSYLYEVETEITAKAVNQIHVEIDIIAGDVIPTEITSSRTKIHTEIVIPTWADYDVLTEIRPRILMVSNIYTRIQVGSVGGAYAFII